MIAQPLGAILRTTKGKKPKQLHDSPLPGLLPYIDISAVENGTQRQWAHPSESKIVSADSLVMVWDGARSGWVGITKFEGALGSTLAALESPLNKRFLASFLREHFSDINANHRGSGIPHVNPDYLKAIEVPVLSEHAQVAIADLADAAADKARSVRLHLAAARRSTQRFRQAVLASACSGRLTADWRQNHDVSAELQEWLAQLQSERASIGHSHGKAPLPPHLAESLPELPGSWKWVSADEVCSTITKGTTPASHLMSQDAGEVPYLKVYNLTFTGLVDFSVRPTFVSQETHSGILRRSRAVPGDVLMNIVGPPLGKVAIVPASYPEWNINQAIAIFRPLRSMRSDFIALCLLSPLIVGAATRRAKATAGQHNLTLEICREVALPLTAPSEQAEILRRVKQLFDVADEAERCVEAASKRVERSSRAVLAKALRGELSILDVEGAGG